MAKIRKTTKTAAAPQVNTDWTMILAELRNVSIPAAELANAADAAGVTPTDYAKNNAVKAFTEEEVKLAEAACRRHSHKLTQANKRNEPTVDVLAEATAKKAEEKAAAKAAKPAATNGSRERVAILGYSATAVLRWMGKQGWTKEEARKVLDAMGGKDLSDITINIQLRAGAKGERGEPAPVTPAQETEMVSAAWPKAKKSKKSKKA